MKAWFPLFALFLPGLVCLQGGEAKNPADYVHAGPAYDEHRLTLTAGHEIQAISPLFYEKQAGEERTWAVPPLLSYSRNREPNLVEFDFAYPLMTYDRYGEDFRWQFFQLLSFAGGPLAGETNRTRFTIFPLYFQQRSSDPAENYTAVGPFYGHLKNRLFRDEIFFVMFPFYAETRKGQVVTDNYLFPFFDVRHGPGLKGWQLWPLMGREHKDITTRTNGFGDVELVPGHESSFVLWPLYFNDHSDVGTEDPVWQGGVLPFYSLERSPKRDSTTVIWPFFSHVDDRGQKYREWDAPWPFVEFARGEGKHTSRVWPFYSHAYNASLEDDFYLWPVYKCDRIRSAPLDRRRRRVLFFVYSDILEKNTETGQSRRRTDLWPLMTRTRELNGNTRLQLLAPLEVWTLGSHKIERDYSPVWSVWVAENNPRSGARSQSLLWNLYRRETAPGFRRISALFGLFDYQSSERGKRLRLFYIPVKRTDLEGRPVQRARKEAKPIGRPVVLRSPAEAGKGAGMPRLKK